MAGRAEPGCAGPVGAERVRGGPAQEAPHELFVGAGVDQGAQGGVDGGATMAPEHLAERVGLSVGDAGEKDVDGRGPPGPTTTAGGPARRPR